MLKIDQPMYKFEATAVKDEDGWHPSVRVYLNETMLYTKAYSVAFKELDECKELAQQAATQEQWVIGLIDREYQKEQKIMERGNGRKSLGRTH